MNVKFDYIKYKQERLTVERLDSLMDFIMASDSSTFGKIMTVVKLVVAFAYIYTRNKLIDNELLIYKQQLEQDLPAQHDEDNEV